MYFNILPGLGKGSDSPFFVIIITTIILLLTSGLADAQDVWTGNVDTNWNTPGNWADGTVPNATDDVDIPSTARSPYILTNTAVAKTVWMQAGTYMSIQAGASLTINGSRFLGGNTAAFFNQGHLDVYGQLQIGNVSDVGKYGLYNKGTVENSGTITVDRSSLSAIDHVSGNFNNNGQIKIGSIASVGQQGLTNEATFNNSSSGEININRSIQVAFFNFAGTFTNAGKIRIGNLADTGKDGIFINNGTISNQSWAEISIDRTTDVAILNAKNLVNGGLIHIGQNAPAGEKGLWNQFVVQNTSSGEIRIDRTTQKGVYNIGGDFYNSGNIIIGFQASVGEVGLENRSNFTNYEGAEIRISRGSMYSIHNLLGVFINNGFIGAGEWGDVSLYGIWNKKTFRNTGTGEIQINQFSTTGLMQTGGELTNEGKLKIGFNTPLCLNGLVSEGGFTNKAGGEIIIFSGKEKGLYHKAGQFTNEGSIDIKGTSGSIDFGLYNVSNFDHLSGIISVQHVLTASVFSSGQSFKIGGSMIIGDVLSGGQYGLWLKGFANNLAGADLRIDRCGTTAVFIESGALTNYGNVTIGEKSSITYGFQVKSGFFNIDCANVHLYGAVQAFPGSIFKNDGLFMVQSEIDHVNNGTFTNNGILSYLSGKIIPGVVNNDMLATPLTSECVLPVSNALKLGPANNFVSETTWYKDQNLSEIAGTYNQVANVFTPTSISTQGTYKLYFNVTNSLLGCSHIAGVQLKIEDKTKPVISCPANTTLAADATCGSHLGSFTLASKSDNCTPAAGITESQSPSPMAKLFGHNSAQTVTLTAADQSGNTQTCQFTVTLKDVTKPVVTCPANTTLAANATCSSAIGAYALASKSDNCTSFIDLNESQNPAPSTQISGHNTVQTVILKATDLAGNSASCTFTVTLKDVTPPSIACPESVVKNALPDQCSAMHSYAVSGSDNCTGWTLSRTAGLPSGSAFPVGQTIVTWQNTDGAGNKASCSFSVSVKDITPPTAICKDATVYLDEEGNGTLMPDQMDNNSIDNCSIVTKTVSKNTFNCSELAGSPWFVTLTVKDAGGNPSNCSAYVTVRDNQAPTAVCENATYQLGSNGMVTVYTDQLADESFDNCSVWSYSPAAVTYNYAQLGAHQLNITVMDWSGNAATCTSVVTIQPPNMQGESGARAHESEVVSSQNKVELAPNPTWGISTLVYTLPQDQDCVISILDSSGKLIKTWGQSGKAGENRETIDVQLLPSGVYFVELKARNILEQKRLVLRGE